MSDHGPRVRSEEDRISTGKILAVGIASLLLFFFASLATSLFFRMRLGEHPPVAIPPELGRSKIGMVEQQIFDKALRGTRDRAAREDRLRSYGWVDPRRGVVHLPIDRAMDLVVQGVRPAPTGPEPLPPGGQP